MEGLENTWTSALADADRKDYERFIDRAAGGHFAQTPAWDRVAKTARPLTTRYFMARRNGRLIGVARVTRPKVIVPLPMAEVERGPVVDRIEDLSELLTALSRTARRHGVAHLRVMPYWADSQAVEASRALERQSFRDVQASDGSHARTLRLDLRGDPFAGAERESLRRKLRRSSDAGVQVSRLGREGVAPLRELYETLMRDQRRSSKPLAYFTALHDAFVSVERGAFFVATHDGETLAAICVLLHREVATFVVGASGGGARRFSKMAGPLAAAIRWAKERGATTFDLGGIPDATDRDPKRLAIAQFKYDFAKNPISLTHEHARFIALSGT